MPELSNELQEAIVHVGTQIRDIRMKRGLSQSELAAKIGVRQPIISRIEKGEHVPTWRNLERITRALDAHVSVGVHDK
jgi:transcriptional regulator with XRE-family HTH domain